MTPDELIGRLRALEIGSSRSTLARWVRQGLIPAPARKSLGRGRGSESIYPDSALGEAAASALLLRWMRWPEVAAIRRLALLEWREEDIAPLGGEISVDTLSRLLPAIAEHQEAIGLPQFIRPSAPLWVALWVRVRDAVNRVDPAALVHQGPLTWEPTGRGTYRLAARR